MKQLYSAQLSSRLPDGSYLVELLRDGESLGHACVRTEALEGGIEVWPAADKPQDWLATPLYDALYDSLRSDEATPLSMELILSLAQGAVEQGA